MGKYFDVQFVSLDHYINKVKPNYVRTSLTLLVSYTFIKLSVFLWVDFDTVFTFFTRINENGFIFLTLSYVLASLCAFVFLVKACECVIALILYHLNTLIKLPTFLKMPILHKVDYLIILQVVSLTEGVSLDYVEYHVESRYRKNIDTLNPFKEGDILTLNNTAEKNCKNTKLYVEAAKTVSMATTAYLPRLEKREGNVYDLIFTTRNDMGAKFDVQ